MRDAFSPTRARKENEYHNVGMSTCCCCCCLFLEEVPHFILVG